MKMLSYDFPNLTHANYKITSPTDNAYNCIAWAYGVKDNWFWPSEPYFWPDNIRYEETLEAFIDLFHSINYEYCDNYLPENNYEKITIYALNDIPTHAARQLSNGKWTSKLGKNIDIEHNTLDCLSGPAYGEVAIIMKRKYCN